MLSLHSPIARTVFKQELAKVGKENVMTKNRDNQYRHELRKKEKEYKKLQDKLDKLSQPVSKVKGKEKVRPRPSFPCRVSSSGSSWLCPADSCRDCAE